MRFDLNSPEELLSALERAAHKFNNESEEYAAIEFSAKCALFICMNGHVENFNEYLASFHAELTDEQIETIKEYRRRGSE